MIKPEFSPEAAVAELVTTAVHIGLNGGEADDPALVAAARSVGEQHGPEALARTAAALTADLVEAAGEVMLTALDEHRKGPQIAGTHRGAAVHRTLRGER